jgi:hypothetical protein
MKKPPGGGDYRSASKIIPCPHCGGANCPECTSAFIKEVQSGFDKVMRQQIQAPETLEEEACRIFVALAAEDGATIVIGPQHEKAIDLVAMTLRYVRRQQAEGKFGSPLQAVEIETIPELVDPDECQVDKRFSMLEFEDVRS